MDKLIMTFYPVWGWIIGNVVTSVYHYGESLRHIHGKVSGLPIDEDNES